MSRQTLCFVAYSVSFLSFALAHNQSPAVGQPKPKLTKSQLIGKWLAIDGVLEYKAHFPRPVQRCKGWLTGRSTAT